MQKRQQIKIARSLFKASQKSGAFDTSKAQSVLKEIVKLKPQGLTGILKNYRLLVSQALSWQNVVVESGEKLTGFGTLEKELLKRTSAKKVVFKYNPSLTFGAKITHGDWVYEDTLNSRLERIIGS